MKISVRAFITAKSEYDSIAKCMDSFSIDADKGVFAVADGVSGSLMAKLWAPLLTDTFVQRADDFFVQDDGGNIILNKSLNLPDSFSSKLVNYMDDLSEDKKERINRQIERYEPTGGSRATFIGLQIKEKLALVNTIGDSIVYTYFNEKIKSCTSMGNGGKIEFTQTPECIASNGKIYGMMKSATIPLENGYIYLMTDGIAKWFYNNDNYKSEKIDKINNLQDHKSFYSFVEEQRKNGFMDDDDTTLLIIKIEESESNDVDIRVDHIDDCKEIELEELRIQNQELLRSNDEMNNQIIDLTSQIKVLNDKNNELCNSIEKKVNQINELQRRIDDAIKNLSNIKFDRNE